MSNPDGTKLQQRPLARPTSQPGRKLTVAVGPDPHIRRQRVHRRAAPPDAVVVPGEKPRHVAEAGIPAAGAPPLGRVRLRPFEARKPHAYDHPSAGARTRAQERHGTYGAIREADGVLLGAPQEPEHAA